MTNFLVDLYAKVIFSLFTFAINILYKKPVTGVFSAHKHDRMLKFNSFAQKAFSICVSCIGKKIRYEYTRSIDYEDCKLLIRPFLFRELIMGSGRWEPYVKDILDREVQRNDVVVDVGANIGVYAIPIAKKVRKVIAFEPHPKTFEILEKSVELNNLSNIDLVKKAVGECNKLVLYGLSTVPQESGVIDKMDRSHDGVIEIECTALDEALSQEDKIDWLLIDVEGFELNVLLGAKRLLKIHSPKIIFELHSQGAHDSAYEILSNEGYTITHIYSIYYYALKTNNPARYGE